MFKPFEEFQSIGGIDDQFPAAVEAIHEDVVKNASGVVAYECVANLSGLHSADVDGDNAIQEVDRFRAFQIQPAHV